MTAGAASQRTAHPVAVSGWDEHEDFLVGQRGSGPRFARNDGVIRNCSQSPASGVARKGRHPQRVSGR
jgi:hypothetical protein